MNASRATGVGLAAAAWFAVMPLAPAVCGPPGAAPPTPVPPIGIAPSAGRPLLAAPRGLTTGRLATGLAANGRATGGLAAGGLAAGLEARVAADICEQVAAAAEAANKLPAGLLKAIGRIESGRWDATRARTVPWPWAINAAGKGQWFETREAAIQAVQVFRAAGVRSIDMGCFQISLLHHPGAFKDLDQAFDPAANAAYAARFLNTLFARAGSWEGAVENYHSADPARGLAYRAQVFSAWFSPGAAPASVHAGMPPELTLPGLAPLGLAPLGAAGAAAIAPAAPAGLLPRVIAGVRIWTPMAAGTAPTIIAMPPPPGVAVAGRPPSVSE